MTFEVRITDHAKQRLRKRLGIKAKACKRMAKKAFLEGIEAHKISDKFYRKQMEDQEKLLIFYQNRIFVYGLNRDPVEIPVLITIYNPDE